MKCGIKSPLHRWSLEIGHFIPYFEMDVIFYPCWDLTYSVSVKEAPGDMILSA